MILVDLNQVIISSLMVSAPGKNIDEKMMRHIALNVLRSYRKKFKEEYGELVICCDNKTFWRKEFFPFYKAHRKKDREKSDYDWHVIFDALHKIRQELKDYFPYKVIDVDRAEADDIIGVLAQSHSNNESVLIISSDKDFLQLQKFKNVRQFSPILQKFLKTDDPYGYVKEHILKGDRGDGIPNFLSPDNTFVSGSRQKVLNKKKMDLFLKREPETYGELDLRGFKRNQTLIDLDYIPLDIQSKIREEFAKKKEKVAGDKLMNYFMTNGLKNLFDSIGDFK